MTKKMKKRMERLIITSELILFSSSTDNIIDDLVKEGFEREDVKEYLIDRINNKGG